MPYRITEIEIAEPLPSVAIPEGDTGVAILLRRNGRPIAFLMEAFPGKSVLSPENLERIIRQGVKPHLLEEDPPEENISSSRQERFPSLTVAICSKDHPKDLAHCLECLMAYRAGKDGGDFEILVVDNAPSDGQTRELATSLPPVKYVMEPKPGLDFARNRALKEATGEMIAFIDDDVTVDRYWLSGLRGAIARHPDAAAFTGLVLPSELATEAQILFERAGGFEKSFETIRYGQTLPGNPFYPCVGGKLGTGCNMAFLRKVALDLGGFDDALDTGPSLPGGGDSDMLYRIIRAGYPLIYEPRFMVFHRHRREYKQLRRQYCRSWGQGLMAFVAKTYSSDVTQRPKLRRLLLWWIGYKLHGLSESLRGKHVLPPGLLLAELWGGIIGLSGTYPRSVRRAERIRKRYSGAMMREQVFLVGLRYPHHALHSGYEAFGRYVGTALAPPVNFRWTQGAFGWPLNQAFCRMVRHPWYSLGAHLTEWSTLRHMVRSRDRVYHALYGDSDLWLLRRANRLTGNRLVASFHQPTDLLRKLGPIERIAKHLDAVILVCEAQRAYFEEFLPPDRIFVVRHGVDTEFFHPTGQQGDQPVCVTVGSHLRDFETHREAIRLVWKENPMVRFLSIGTRSDKKSYFPDLPDERIRFLDKVSDEELRRAYQTSNVAVFSYEAATANNALLEAMSSGLPIVATEVGGIREYVGEEAGILCPRKDPRALADGILHLLNDEAAREKMANASRSKALSLDFRVVADRMREIYTHVLRYGS